MRSFTRAARTPRMPSESGSVRWYGHRTSRTIRAIAGAPGWRRGDASGRRPLPSPRSLRRSSSEWFAGCSPGNRALRAPEEAANGNADTATRRKAQREEGAGGRPQEADAQEPAEEDADRARQGGEQ